MMFNDEQLVALALRLKELEQGMSSNRAAAIEAWHQVILLSQSQLKVLQPTPFSKSLFNRDYYAWVKEQIRLLHLRQFEHLDLKHLPDELNDLARLVQQDIETNLEIICNHLLKYKYAQQYLNDEPCCSSWRSTLWMARNTIADELQDNPSLQNSPAEELDSCYQLAVAQVYQETKLPDDMLPKNCPWTVNQIITQSWLPE